MLYAGLDLSRKRLDFHLLDADGATVEVGAAPPDVDGLGGLTQRLARHGEPIRAAIESMNGAWGALIRSSRKSMGFGMRTSLWCNALAARARAILYAKPLEWSPPAVLGSERW
jgi:hypothetical protein